MAYSRESIEKQETVLVGLGERSNRAQVETSLLLQPSCWSLLVWVVHQDTCVVRVGEGAVCSLGPWLEGELAVELELDLVEQIQ